VGFGADSVCCEEVRFYDISDVGPIPEVCVVADLPFGLASSDYLGETFKVLSIARAKCINGE
jgi:hypothetical protein